MAPAVASDSAWSDETTATGARAASRIAARWSRRSSGLIMTATAPMPTIPNSEATNSGPIRKGDEDPLSGFDSELLEPATQSRSQPPDLVVGQGSTVGSDRFPLAISLPDPVEQEVVSHVEDGLPHDAETRAVSRQ